MENKRRYTITILVSEVNEYGEDVDNVLSIGPDFAHTDLKLVEWQAKTLNQMASLWMEHHLPGATPLELISNEDTDPLYAQVMAELARTNAMMEKLGLKRRYTITKEDEDRFMIHVIRPNLSIADGRTEDSRTMINILEAIAESARKSAVYFSGESVQR